MPHQDQQQNQKPLQMFLEMLLGLQLHSLLDRDHPDNLILVTLLPTAEYSRSDPVHYFLRFFLIPSPSALLRKMSERIFPGIGQ